MNKRKLFVDESSQNTAKRLFFEKPEKSPAEAQSPATAEERLNTEEPEKSPADEEPLEEPIKIAQLLLRDARNYFDGVDNASGNFILFFVVNAIQEIFFFSQTELLEDLNFKFKMWALHDKANNERL